MNVEEIKCLLLEDEESSVRLLQQYLAQEPAGIYRLDVVGSLSAGLEKLALQKYDVILLDLFLEDSRGLDSFDKIFPAAPQVPIIIITNMDDEQAALKAIQDGAQDYILKSDLQGKLLARTIDYAIERKNHEKALKESENQKKAILNAIASRVYYLDSHFHIIWLNKAALEETGKPQQDVTGQKCYSICQGRETACADCPVTSAIESKASKRGIITVDSGKVLDVRAEPVLNKEGEFQGVVAVCRDITEEQKARETLDKLSTAIEQNPASVVITDQEGTVEYVNAQFTMATGYEFAEIIGKKISKIKSGYTDDDVYRDLWRTILAGEEWRGEIENKKKNGELFWEHITISPVKDKEGKITHFLSLHEDLTHRKEYESYLEVRENYDRLTGLPNEKLASDRIAQAIVRSRRGNQRTAVMRIDINQLEVVNNTFGESIGDELLMDVAGRLKNIVRGSDTVARFADDEFLIVLPDPETLTHITIVAKKVLDVFEKSFSLGGHDVFVTASIAITVYPDDGDTEDDLLQNIEKSMMRAKEQEANTFKFFSHEMNEQALERLKMESNFENVLEKNELLIYYQPVVDLRSLKVIGAEALLRWNNPELGMVYPDSFIPLAEDTGLIIPIGAWVFNGACAKLQEWQEHYGPDFKMFVNVSPKQFANNKIIEMINLSLNENAVAANSMNLDIKESLIMDSSPRATNILNQLSLMGIQLALDDFGTGFSALGNLKKIPFSIIRIDRSLIGSVTTDKASASISSAIIAMAHRLGFKVIAEGVETEDQLEFLKLNECDMAQGYYFSMPVSAANFTDNQIKK